MVNVFLQFRNPSLDGPPFRFQFGFTGAAGTDTAPQARHGLTAPDQPRQLIFQLGELDLEFSGSRLGPLGKDIQDHFGAIDGADAGDVFQVAGLDGGEVAIEHN